MKIIYSSQFRDSSGYASAARSYLEAVDGVIDQYNIDFKILSIAVEEINNVSPRQEELICKYEISLSDVDEYIKEDYLLIWHQPTGMILYGDGALSKDPKWIAFKKLLNNANRNVNMTVWESNKIPDAWTTLHKKYKTTATIVPCHQNQEIFSSAGLKSYYLPHVISDNIVDPVALLNFPLDLDNLFVAFSMSQWIHRKGFDALVKAFCMEFNNTPDAVLIIKTYINAMNVSQFNMKTQSQHIQKEIIDIKKNVFKNGRPSDAKIVALCNILPFKNISWLYSKSDVFALATRGEGFGLTISEAIMHEKPVIVPNYGGHTDYVDPDNNFLIEGHDHPYIGDPTYDYDMNWYEPDIISIRKQFREAYNLWKEEAPALKEMGIKSKKHVTAGGFDLDTIGHSFMNIIKEETKTTFKTVKEEIRSYSKDSKKIEILKDAFVGQDCYILSCGPGLTQYDPEFLKEKIGDKLVFAIKQAYEYVPEIADFHFFNANNFQVYKYEKSKPIVVANSAEQELAMIHHIWTNKQHYDIFAFTPDDRDFSKSICKSLEFDKYLFENTLSRPWGPGMMTEIVIYMAIHLGVKNIYTIGWDLEAPGETKSNHYYGERSLTRPADPMKQEEIILNIETTKHLHKWLKSKDINLYVANDNSHVHNSIPRSILK
tara:strand:- start:2043 stop:4013 length:1971 start_codon:yes stop_codon:yes gene_type:complete